MPGGDLLTDLAAPGADAGATAYRRSPTVVRGPGRSLMATAHKPGIISLRPLSLGDVLDGAVKHVRRNPGPVLGLTFIALAAAVVPSLLVAGLVRAGTWYGDLGAEAVIDASGFSTLVLAAGVGFAALLLSGMLSYSVAESVLGRRPPLGELWRLVRRRVPALVGLQLLTLVAVAGPVVLLFLAVAAVAGQPAVVVVVVVLVGGLAVAGWSAFVGIGTLLAAPALVLEKRGIRGAIRRAWGLSRHAFWRLTGTTLVVGALAWLVFFVVELPLVLVGGLLTLLVDLTPSADAALTSVLLNVSTLLAAALVVPFVAGATTLLYVDQRMRKEGFDLVLLRAASTRTDAATRGGR